MVVYTIEKDITIIKKITWPQWIAGIGVTLLILQVGLMAGWSSPYIAYLTSPESHMPITKMQASWVVSLLNLGRLVGAILGSISVNYLGTKRTILLSSMPIALCWLFIIIANRVEWLYTARFLGGIGLGMTYSSFSLYLAEIADPSIRGALVILAMSGLTIGSLIICIMGAYISMIISSIVNLVLCIILMIIFIWLPESPHHFVKVEHEDKARSSILWYHRGCDVESELQSLKKFIEMNNSKSLMEVLKEFKYPHIRKATLLIMTLYMYTMMSGLINVIFYMETILRTAKVTVIEPSVVVIIVHASGIGSSLLSMLFIDKFGRKIMLNASYITCAISLICLSTEFQLLDAGYDPARLQGFMIFATLFSQTAIFIGIIAIPNMVLGEIFPPHVKCVAACFGSIFAGTFSFISAATYQLLIDWIQEKYVFFLYAAFLLTAIPYTLLCMPETKGKTLQQIQEELTKKR